MSVRLGTGIDETAAAAAGACASSLGDPAGATLGIVYASDHHAGAFPTVIDELRRRTGVERWVGSVATGVLAGADEFIDAPVVAAMTLDVPGDAWTLLPPVRGGPGGVPAAACRWAADRAPVFGVVHADPRTPDLADLLTVVADETAAFLVGGLTSSRGVAPAVAGEVAEGCVSGVLFGADVVVSTGLSQGCVPLGPVHTVTDCIDNVLVALDGRPALDVLKADVGEVLARDLRRIGGYVHAALPLPGSDTGDYTVRTLTGLDPARGWVAIGHLPSPGERLMFVRRDPASARQDLERMAAAAAGRLAGPARAALYFSCVARGPHMFGEPGGETAVLRRRLGDVPLLGFSCAGEISHGRLYGFTGVLALFA